ncbi:hypothetical protein F5Y15DRAFT_419728 [Xylariaceae sp. FL0016]|nr:hypothetical protein F5Y15DRAFT_419728 [Xylariaceae sp. FL0016]
MFRRSEFDKSVKIDKRDFSAIEFLLRKGKRQLDVYSAPGIKDIRKGVQVVDRKSPIQTRQVPTSIPRIKPPKQSLQTLYPNHRLKPGNSNAESAVADMASERSSVSHAAECEPEDPYWGNLQPPISAPADRYSSSNQNARDYTTGNDASPVRKSWRSYHEPPAPKRQCDKEKRYGIADPATWDAISRALMQQRRLSDFIGIDTSPEPMELLDVPSRTSSQRRALRRFERELEKYADVAGAAGRAPVITPTVSESKPSYHTIEPLLPFRDEFRAAGLAVTSSEQGDKLKAQAQSGPAWYNTGMVEHRGLSKVSTSDYDGTNEKPGTYPSSFSSSPGSFVQFTQSHTHNPHVLRNSSLKSKEKVRAKHKEPLKTHRFFPWLRKKSPPVKKDSKQHQHHPHHLIHHSPQKSKGHRHVSARSKHSSSCRHHRREAEGQTGKRPHTQKVATESPSRKATELPRNLVSPPKKPPVALSTAERRKRDECPQLVAGKEYRSVRSDSRRSQMPSGIRIKGEAGRSGVSRPRNGLIETIEEEKELPQGQIDDQRGYHRLQSERKKGKSPAKITPAKVDAISPQTTVSSVPSLPYTAKYAVSTTSSLERALKAVSKQIEEEEEQAEKQAQSGNYHPTLGEKTNQPRRSKPRQVAVYHAAENQLPRQPRPDERFIFVDRYMPTTHENPRLNEKPLPPEPTREAPAIPPNPPAKGCLHEMARPDSDHTRDLLKDLDVIINEYADGDIKDRDVIEGLQVAVHAAADDQYDAYLGQKTGLRIRRFLADLKSVDEIPQRDECNGPTRDQPARRRRAEKRRVQRVNDRRLAHLDETDW